MDGHYAAIDTSQRGVQSRTHVGGNYANTGGNWPEPVIKVDETGSQNGAKTVQKDVKTVQKGAGTDQKTR